MLAGNVVKALNDNVYPFFLDGTGDSELNFALRWCDQNFEPFHVDAEVHQIILKQPDSEYGMFQNHRPILPGGQHRELLFLQLLGA